MSSEVSATAIDEVYEEVRDRFGVLGGKIIGAGGGGFLMLYSPKENGGLEDFMAERGMPRLYYYLEREGAKIVANVASTQSMILHPRPVDSRAAATTR